MIYFKKAPLGITDFKNNPISEGDVIEWPEYDSIDDLGVVGYEPSGSQFRIQFNPITRKPSCHIGLQMGKKGKARVIGSIYDEKRFIELKEWRKIK